MNKNICDQPVIRLDKQTNNFQRKELEILLFYLIFLSMTFNVDIYNVYISFM